MRIVCIEYYLLVHFSEGERGDGRNGKYLKSMLVFGVAGAGVSVAL